MITLFHKEKGDITMVEMFLLFVIMISILICCVVLILYIPNSVKKRHTAEYDALFKNYVFKAEDKGGIDRAILRSISYITTHHRYQVIDKAISVAALTFSIGGALLSSMQYVCSVSNSISHLLTCIICLLGTIFVICAVYLSPQKRIEQYKDAWASLDRAIHSFYSGDASVGVVLQTLSDCEDYLDCDKL